MFLFLFYLQYLERKAEMRALGYLERELKEKFAFLKVNDDMEVLEFPHDTCAPMLFPHDTCARMLFPHDTCAPMLFPHDTCAPMLFPPDDCVARISIPSKALTVGMDFYILAWIYLAANGDPL